MAGYLLLLADSRIKNLEIYGHTLIDYDEMTNLPNLDEHKKFNEVKVYKQDRLKP